MESRVKLFGHALHPILIVFPLGLLATAVIFDIIYLATNRLVMNTVAYWMIVAGLIGGFIAAVFGWIDWFGIPQGTRAKRVGLMHGIGNVVVLLLFLASWWMRNNNPDYLDSRALVFSFIGAGLALVTSWMGGELVERLGVGVSENAHLNAPNSLADRHTHEN